MNLLKDYITKIIDVYKNNSSTNIIRNTDKKSKQNILSTLHISTFYYPYIVKIDFHNSNSMVIIKSDKVTISNSLMDEVLVEDDSDIFNLSLERTVPEINFEIINSIRENMKDFSCDSLIDIAICLDIEYYTEDKVEVN
ncbi:hypothetical protein XaC1_166 [Xanthomonas phage XaC1]|nr:hypothetical protein XaC1_166 [Xanthomonas phage XaC1]